MNPRSTEQKVSLLPCHTAAGAQGYKERSRIIGPEGSGPIGLTTRRGLAADAGKVGVARIKTPIPRSAEGLLLKRMEEGQEEGGDYLQGGIRDISRVGGSGFDGS